MGGWVGVVKGGWERMVYLVELFVHSLLSPQLKAQLIKFIFYHRLFVYCFLVPKGAFTKNK